MSFNTPDLRSLAIEQADCRHIKCVYDDIIITVSNETGYFDACELCASFNNEEKTFARWLKSAEGESCISALEKQTGLVRSKLILIERSGNNSITWAHPNLILYLAMWCSRTRGFEMTATFTNLLIENTKIEESKNNMRKEIEQLSLEIAKQAAEIKEFREIMNRQTQIFDNLNSRNETLIEHETSLFAQRYFLAGKQINVANHLNLE